MPASEAAALETDSEASGESVDVQIADLRLADRPDRAPSVARAAAAPSPARGPSTRRSSSLTTYTGVLPGQAPARSRSARAASPELRYSIPLAGRRTSAPPVTPGLSTLVAAAAPVAKLERRLSTTAGRPPSPAPPGFKTSLRPLGAARAGLSPISPPAASAASKLPASIGSTSSRARSRSPAPRGLVRAASPSPTTSPPVVRARAAAPTSSSVRSASPESAHAASPSPAPAVAQAPVIIRGFDLPSSGSAPRQGLSALPPSPSMSARTLGLGIRSSRIHHGPAGPIVRPPSALLDRTADQRLEVAASRDFERIDDYYAARYAAAEAAAQAGEPGRYATSGTTSREQRMQKRAAEERLRRGYDRVIS
ncbi:hypothetical protein BMF94_2831 [Rhodotorula taiwanensis]|uniref:Uncharacterized protein n=1 Tax=Rhodotorula taiwanensis TaxID=741276 RepID=A0A2S5BB71_9BASI|nr:hypothetical protein BMF94_2831 [Rhodotorula taiwanensis]